MVLFMSASSIGNISYKLAMYISDEEDKNTEFYLPNSTYIGGDNKKMTLPEIKRRLEVCDTACCF